MKGTRCSIPITQIREHPDDPRYSKVAIDELAASIAALGLIEPLLVSDLVTSEEPSPTPYTVLSGHRRLAALKQLGFERVDVTAVHCDSDRARELRLLMASNTAREQLTPLEEARGYQAMLDLGLKAADVAKAVGRKKAYVERTAKLAGAFSDEHREELVARPVSLEEYEVLARHKGSPERYKGLLAHVGSRSFKWQAENADQAAKREAVAERARARLQKSGVKIAKVGGDKVAELRDLKDAQGKGLTAKTHASCPGHAAHISQWVTNDRDAITYVCTDWRANGHAHKWLSGDGEGRSAYAEDQARDRAWKKRIKPTTDLRRTFVRDLLALPAKRPPGGKSEIPGAGGFLLAAALNRGFEADGELACDLLGVKVKAETTVTTSPSWRGSAQEAFAKHDPIRALLALACAAGDEAVRRSKDPSSHYWDLASAQRHLKFLEGAGYVLSDVERELVAGETKEVAGETFDPDNLPDDFDPDSPCQRCKVRPCVGQDQCARVAFYMEGEPNSDGAIMDGEAVPDVFCPYCGELDCELSCTAAIVAGATDTSLPPLKPDHGDCLSCDGC
jgi:ParB/RepB/Spo0J family partition protein